MKQETHYLNTDLDLTAQQDLAPLADALAERGLCVLHTGQWEDGAWMARFEMEDQFAEPDLNINALLTAVDSLDEPSRRLWTTCSSRTFNIGYYCADEPRSFSQQLETTTLTRIADAGAALVITLYPASPDASAAASETVSSAFI